MLRVLAAGMCVLVATAGVTAAGAATDPPQRSFTASTGGTPVALATGGWRDEPDGGGRLEVDFASGPVPVQTTFAATWVTSPVLLRESPHPQTVAGVLAVEHLGNNATATDIVLRVEYRTRQVGGSWSAWVTAADDAYTRPARQPQARLFSVPAQAVSSCECPHQAEFRVSGSKAGVDLSRLTVVTFGAA
jgi:hypothetical protein